MKTFSNLFRVPAICLKKTIFVFVVFFLLFPFLSHPSFAKNELNQTKIIDWQINKEVLEIKIMAPKDTKPSIYIDGNYVGQTEIINSNNNYNLSEFKYSNFKKSKSYTLEVINQNSKDGSTERDLINFNFFTNIKENNPEAPKLLTIEKNSEYLIIRGYSKDLSNTYFYLNKILFKNDIVVKNTSPENNEFVVKLKYNNNKDVCVYAYLKKDDKLSEKSNILCYKNNVLDKNQDLIEKSSNLDNKLNSTNTKETVFINIKSPKNNSNIYKSEIETIIKSQNCNKISLYINNDLFETKKLINKHVQETIFKNNSLDSGKYNIYAKCINTDLNIEKNTEIIKINVFKPEIEASAKENIKAKEINNENNNILNKNNKTKTFLTNNEKVIFSIFVLSVLLWLFWNNKNIIRKK